jgi:excisionase family DNA binding protein
MSSAHSTNAEHVGHARAQPTHLRQPDAAGMPPRVLLTPEEAAQSLGISRSKLYELLRAGAIDSIQIDRLRRIPVQALHEFVARLREA